MDLGLELNDALEVGPQRVLIGVGLVADYPFPDEPSADLDPE